MPTLKKILKWTVIVVLSYLVVTTLYFGYDDIDSKRGIYKFYWSGIRGIWENDRDFGFKVDEMVTTSLEGVDGPHIIGDSIFFVDHNGVFKSQTYDERKTLVVHTQSVHLNKFNLKIKDSLVIEKSDYKMPKKLIAISDIEGNFDGLVGFLIANKVIDKQANWIFGDGHVIFNGDFMDRGNQVTQVLWLIYSLEQQAINHGGKVHFILGNHEIMNMYGDVSYNDFKYIEVAKRISKKNDWDKSLQYLYSEFSELGIWLRSKNIVEKIGDIIFVHGGLNLYHVEKGFNINELNTISRMYFGIAPEDYGDSFDRHQYIINSSESPYWDRRLNLDFKYKVMYSLNGMKVEPITSDQLSRILSFYNAKRIVIGHSVVDDIKLDYENKVIKIDVKHGSDFATGETKGLLIENHKFYKVNDLGQKEELSTYNK